MTTPESKRNNPLEKLGEAIEKSVKDGLRKLDAEASKKKNGKPAFYYLKTFLRDEKVATVHPSSRFVVKRVLKELALKDAKVVVEYGPADGVITKEVLKHLPHDGTMIAIERNLDFYNALKSEIKDPRLKAVHGDVQDVERIVKGLGFDHVDRIFSGIPFSFLTPAGRDALLAATARTLNHGGRFVPYQFTTHLIPLLKRHFHKVEVGFEIINLPPVFVFTCVKK
jgi:phospholipid N-methyltransferase